MKADRKATDAYVRKAWNLGMVEAIAKLIWAGWTSAEIAEEYDAMFKAVAADAIAAAGLNGEPPSADIAARMKLFGKNVATTLIDKRIEGGR
jgi:hypothetical protein